MSFLLEELPSLALFARVVQLRSFTAAARDVGLAKSAVSHRVARLEAKLGVQLLRRTTRKLTLTDEGLRVYEHCATLVSAADAAHESVAGASERLEGTVRVNAPVTFGQMHLARAVASFLERHPSIDVSLSTDDRIVDVVEGGFDVVVRIGQPRDSGLVSRKLATDRLVVCGSPEYLARAGTPETPDELVRHNCLHYSLVSRASEWRFRGSKGGYAVPVRGNFESSDGTVLSRAALAGLGLAVVPSFMVADDVTSGRLVTVLDRHRRAQIGIFAVFSDRRNLPRRTRVFLDFLVARFAKTRFV